MKNAHRLNVDINKAETVVLSHGHWDHGNGLKYLKNKNLICHPNTFIKRYRRNEKFHIGLELSEKELRERFQIITSKEPYYITNNIIFLGEIPRLNSVEAQTTSFVDEHGNDDFVLDDSALAIMQDGQVIIVTGCSHSGICNIVEYAKSVTGLEKIKTVIGGFHLAQNNNQTQQTISYFKEQQVENLLSSPLY